MLKTPVILDVRTAEEFSEGFAPNSINIPLQELEQHISTLPKDRPIVVCCESGGRARVAEMILRSHGFEQVVCGGSWRNIEK